MAFISQSTVRCGVVMSESQSKKSLTRRQILAASAGAAAALGAAGLPVLQTAKPAIGHGKLRA
jgi:hypothetical protein